jgi:hypothetical protein
MSPNNKGSNRWWWLPGACSGTFSFLRLVYEVLRDHHYPHWG